MKVTIVIFLIFVLNLHLYSQMLNLRYGDLLFQQVECGTFCQAIERVTPSYKGHYFNHVGMVVFKDTNIFVFEAISRGVVFTPLDSFILRSGKHKIWVGRVNRKFLPHYNELIPFLNKPYDSVFDISNDAYYCSELIYFLYKNKKNRYFFSLQPMTFKEPGSNIYFSVWIDYFNKMKTAIPEGKPGINPGGMINEKKIKIVPLVRKKT